MGQHKTVSTAAGASADPSSTHIPTGAPHPSPPPGDEPPLGNEPSLGPSNNNALSRLIGGGSTDSLTGSSRHSPPADPDRGVASTPTPSTTPGPTRAPPSKRGGPFDERRRYGLSQPPSLQPRPPPVPSRPCVTGAHPTTAGQAPHPALDTDEDVQDRIFLTAAELQAIIQAHIQQLQPSTAAGTLSVLLPSLPVGAAGPIVHEGSEFGPSACPHKRTRHYLPRDNQVYEAIDPTVAP
ncbi:hypothetical protein F5887DRAFT_1173622 [Amanita rubescens]|nr:hypothetical protein F5887DRAFT_1173622 [Amanita rubescens]